MERSVERKFCPPPSPRGTFGRLGTFRTSTATLLRRNAATVGYAPDVYYASACARVTVDIMRGFSARADNDSY